MLEITIPTEPKAFVWLQPRTSEDGTPANPITWEVTVRPADGVMRSTMLNERRGSYYMALALECVDAITRAEYNGGPVKVNGKMATDPAMRDMVLRNFVGFSSACGREAARLGELVEVERGNS